MDIDHGEETPPPGIQPEVQAAPRPKRAYTRQSTRQLNRDPSREPARSDGVIYGRDGEVLSRKRTEVGDIFAIPQELKDDGWDYQWAAVAVAGNQEVLIDQNLMFAENGWRPVPCDRWPGRFMPHGHKGPIIRGQQMLMERPMELTLQARREEYQKAAGQMRDRDQALMGRKANLKGALDAYGMPIRGGYPGRTGNAVGMSIDPAVDAPRPEYELAEPGQ